MTTYRTELTIPIEYDRRKFSDRYRQRVHVDRDGTASSRLHSSSVRSDVPQKPVRTIPWHCRFSDGSKGLSGFDGGDEWFNAMRRRFDERRKRWDEDIRQMRADFFAHRPSHGRRSVSPPKVHLPRPTQFPNHPFTQEYFTGSDGKVYFTVNFDVSDFRPEEISVSIRGDEVLVTAKSEQNTTSGSSCKEYTKTVKLPESADDILADCTLTSDGVLTFCCPLKQNILLPKTASSAEAVRIQNASVGNSQNTSLTDQVKYPSDRIFTHRVETETPAQSHLSYPSRSVHGSLFSLSSLKPKYRVEIPMDPDYLPEDIQIRTLNHRIYITVRHQERNSHRTSVKEFSKEYDLPDNVDPENLKAKLVAGTLYIESAESQ
ncbi:unnamed protein product [Dicrocoelium dendriticum]|nr:unnamed protein product [Dicrocoelium dendriticum]